MGLSSRHAPTNWRGTFRSHMKGFVPRERPMMGSERSGESLFGSVGSALCGHDIVWKPLRQM